MTVDSLSFRRALNPADPEVEGEFNLSEPGVYELTVSQSFDFPTVYSQRNKISRMSIEKSKLDFWSSKRDLLLEISQLYTQMVYQSRLVETLAQRQSMLAVHLEIMQKALEKGSITSIDQMQFASLLSGVESELVLARSQLEQTERSLRQYNASKKVHVGDYPLLEAGLSQQDFVERAYALDPEVLGVKIDSLIAQSTLRLSNNEWLPRLTVGYKLESSPTMRGHIVTGGVSLPLWQNRGNVKHAKAMITGARIQKQEIESRLRTMLENLYEQWVALDVARSKIGDDDAQFLDLLGKSSRSGAITSTTFVMNLAERYELQNKRLELDLQKAQIGAAMMILMNH